MATLVRRAMLLGAMVIAPIGLARAQTHVYELNGTLADQLGGPSLVSDGGTLTATGYDFLANQGLNLSNVFTSNVYTIALEFQLTNINGFVKLIDFHDKSSDDGFYDLNGQLNFFNDATGPTAVIPASTEVFVVLTRNASNQIAGYVNGALQFTTTDLPGDADFSSANNIARFFEDDTDTGGREASDGSVDYIATYDTALNEDQAESLRKVPPLGVTGTPEPGSIVLTGTGLAGIVGFVRRRRRAA